MGETPRSSPKSEVLGAELLVACIGAVRGCGYVRAGVGLDIMTTNVLQ